MGALDRSQEPTLKLSRLRLFFSRFVVAPSGCWEWNGALNGNGYGMFSRERGVSMMAYRLSYSWLVGPIPTGYEIDHLCRNRRCVNPTHLEAVTRAMNTRRAVAARGPYCRRGHLLTPENTRYGISHGYRCRRCITCRREREACKGKVA